MSGKRSGDTVVTVSVTGKNGPQTFDMRQMEGRENDGDVKVFGFPYEYFTQDKGLDR